MNKKGFTLLELLAVIVVLAIIALIVTPFVTKAINEAKKGAALNSANGLIKAAEVYYAQRLTTNLGDFTEEVLTFSNGTITKNGETFTSLKYKGEKPISGTLTINSNGEIVLNDIKFDKYICNGTSKIKVTCISAETNSEPTQIDLLSNRLPGLYIPNTTVLSKVMIDGNPVDATWANIKLAFPSAFAEEGKILGNNGTTSYLTSLFGDLVIDEDINFIGANAFLECDGLISIIMPDTITTIEARAFRLCRGLTNIKISNALTQLPEYFLAGSNRLREIIIPEGIISIGERAFEYCDILQSITLPEGLLTISYEAFKGNASLNTVMIPSTVTSVDRIFRECSQPLKIIMLKPEGSISGAPWEASNATVIYDPVYIAVNDNIKDELTFNYFDATAYEKNTEIIVNSTLLNREITSITINGTKVNGNTFTIGESDVILSNYTYKTLYEYDDELLVKSPGLYETGSNTLKKITIGGNEVDATWDNIKMAFPNAFVEIGKIKGNNGSSSYFTSLSGDLVIGTDIAYIGTNAFLECDGLTSIVMPDSVVKVEERAFRLCRGLTNVRISNNLIEIPNYFLAGASSLKTITIPVSVMGIGERAFEGCNALEKVNFSEGILWIGYETFKGNTSLSEMIIPTSVRSIDRIFRECSQSLKIIMLRPEGYLTGAPWEASNATVIYDPVYIYINKSLKGKLFLNSKSDYAYAKNTDITINPDVLNQRITSLTVNEQVINSNSFNIGSNNAVLSNYTYVTEQEYSIESSHDYGNNLNGKVENTSLWTKQIAGANSIDVYFSTDSNVESGYDNIWIYNSTDEEATPVYQLTNVAMAGKRYTISGDTIVIRLTTDGSGTRYGFKATIARSS